MTSGCSPINHMLDWNRNLDGWLRWISLGASMDDNEAAKWIRAGVR